MVRPSIIERAYELARSGACRGSNDVRQALRAEDYTNSDVNLHIRGPSLVRTLNRICRQARSAREA
ncbi:MAG TPA: hypothetical protein VMU37_00045 [Caulobacteraceae bacterium]|nr:hypothetical protein [Caulobacteraceae bacterium]